MRSLRAGDLTLEPLVAGHAALMWPLLLDPAIYEFENEPPPSAEWLSDRYRRLESRQSPDGTERWLNWAVRLPAGDLAGFVQATLRADGTALVAYVFASVYWGRGFAHRAVAAMLDELAVAYGVRTAFAVFKQRNARSRRLLDRLGFEPVGPERAGASLEHDEALYERRLG